MLKSFLYDDILVLNFCSLADKDCATVLDMRNDERVAQWMYASHISKQTHLEFIKNLKTNQNSAYWLFKKADIPLGVGSLSRIDIVHKHAFVGIYKNQALNDIGYNPKASVLSKGAGSIILSIIERIASEELGLNSLHLEVIESNRRAINFYEGHNYEYGGKLRGYILKDGLFYDVLIYSKILEN